MTPYVKLPCGHDTLGPRAVFDGSMNRTCKICNRKFSGLVKNGVVTEWRDVK